MFEPKYAVGRTIVDNTPCILRDGDSVVAIFTSIPHGEREARQICSLLNLEVEREFEKRGDVRNLWLQAAEGLITRLEYARKIGELWEAYTPEK